MKFFGGFIAGIIATIIVYYVYTTYKKPEYELEGLVLFKKTGECITNRNLKIFQTIRQNVALAQIGRFPNETLVLLVNYSGQVYYDDKKIAIPKGQCARQIGIYQYETNLKYAKTVPVVEIQ
jgi:hypothetical protein